MAGSQGYHGGSGQRDGMQETLVIGIGIVVAVLFLWWRNHTWIADAVMHVRLWESWLASGPAAAAIDRWIATTPAAEVTVGQLWRSGVVLGHTWIRWAAMGILLVLGGGLLYRHPDWPGRYNRIYSMKSLARQESALWPAIRPVLDENLVDVDLDDPVQGMRQTPRAYGRRLKFVVPAASLRRLPPEAEPISSREVLLVGRARKVFGLQLGPRWQGIDRLKPHERALFAAFAAQACYANEAALAQIDALPAAYLKAVKTGDPRWITTRQTDALLKAHGESAVVKKVLARHGYVRTVLMALLMAARKNGKLPACWFRWLKTVDRITWYALNDLGTENASAEAAGVRSHYNAERLIRGELTAPEVEAAIDGLREYLQEVLDEDPDDDA